MSIFHSWTFPLLFVNRFEFKTKWLIKLWVIRKGSCTVSNKKRLWWEYNSRSMYCRWCHSGGSVPLLRQPWKPTIVSQATFLCCAFQKRTGKGQMTQIKYFDIGFWNLFIQKFHIIKQNENMTSHYSVSYINNTTNFS